MINILLKEQVFFVLKLSVSVYTQKYSIVVQ